MKKLLSILTLFLSISAVAGGGWPKEKGKGYFKLSEWWIVADKHFTGSGKIDPNATRGTFTTSVYGEYGITNRLTGIAYVPLFVRTYQNAQISGTTGQVLGKGEALNSFGDVNIGLKYGLTKSNSKYVAAATLTLGLPTGNSSGGTDGSFQTGDGEFNQMIQFDISRSFKLGSIHAFANAYSGFNNRTNNYSDEFRYGAELGAAFAKQKLWFFTKLNVIESLKNGLTTPDGAGSIFSNNMEFASYTLEAAYYLNKEWGITVGYSGAIRGEIIFANPAYSIGIFLDLK